jgi:hypothetical protein
LYVVITTETRGLELMFFAFSKVFRQDFQNFGEYNKTECHKRIKSWCS